MGRNKFTALKFPRHCPFVLIVKGGALGVEGVEVIGSGLFCYATEEKMELLEYILSFVSFKFCN